MNGISEEAADALLDARIEARSQQIRKDLRSIANNLEKASACLGSVSERLEKRAAYMGNVLKERKKDG